MAEFREEPEHEDAWPWSVPERRQTSIRATRERITRGTYANWLCWSLSDLAEHLAFVVKVVPSAPRWPAAARVVRATALALQRPDGVEVLEEMAKPAKKYLEKPGVEGPFIPDALPVPDAVHHETTVDGKTTKATGPRCEGYQLEFADPCRSSADVNVARCASGLRNCVTRVLVSYDGRDLTDSVVRQSLAGDVVAALMAEEGYLHLAGSKYGLVAAAEHRDDMVSAVARQVAKLERLRREGATHVNAFENAAEELAWAALVALGAPTDKRGEFFKRASWNNFGDDLKFVGQLRSE